MESRSIKLVPAIALVGLFSLFVLRLQADILAQTLEPDRDVPESRQPMGMNLSPYAPDGAPINDEVVSDLENLGVKWMRFEFRAKGTPSDIPYDDYHLAVDNLAARGVEVLGLIDYTTLPLPKEEWSTTDYRDEFVSLTSRIVGEFKDQIHAWEIWNEEDIGYDPDYPNAGGETYLSPMHYAYLLGGDPTANEFTHPSAAQGVYEAIKEQDSEATVLLGGLSNAWKGEDGRGAGHYLHELYQQLAALGYGPGSWPFDVVGVHPYYGLEPDPAIYLFDGGEYILRANLWTVMEENGDGDKHFWITEIGWNTNDKQWACIFPSVSEASQAGYLYRSWDIFLSEPTSESEVLVDKVFWFMYQDTGIWVDPEKCPLLDGLPAAAIAADPHTRIMPPRVTPTPAPDRASQSEMVVIDFWFGVVHGDYVPKPSYYVYRMVGQVESTIYLPLILRSSTSP